MKNINKNIKTISIVSILFVGMLICATIFNIKTVNAIVPIPSVIYPDLIPTSDMPYIIEVPSFEYDYYIGKLSNSSYYIVNGSNGDRMSISTNSCALLDMALVNCSSGDKIVVSSDVVFAVDSEVFIINKPLTLSSFGLGNIQTSGTVGATFTFFRDSEVIHIAKSDGSALEGITLDGFRFTYDGSARTISPVIGLSDVSYSRFKDLYINMNGANSTIIYVYANNSFCVGNSFESLTLRGFGAGTAIDFESTSEGIFCNCNWVINCRLWNGATAIMLGGKSGFNGENDFNFFRDNVYDSTSVYSIYDNGTGNSFDGGVFMDIVSGSTYYQGIGAIYSIVSGISAINSEDGYYNVTNVYGDLFVNALPPN